MARSVDEINITGWTQIANFSCPNYDVQFEVKWTDNSGVNQVVSGIMLNLRDQLSWLRTNQPDLLKDRLLNLMVEAERLKRGID